jgi:hypothetical protein
MSKTSSSVAIYGGWRANADCLLSTFICVQVEPEYGDARTVLDIWQLVNIAAISYFPARVPGLFDLPG